MSKKSAGVSTTASDSTSAATASTPAKASRKRTSKSTSVSTQTTTNDAEAHGFRNEVAAQLAEKTSGTTEKVVDTSVASQVSSSHQSAATHEAPAASQSTNDTRSTHHMGEAQSITLTKSTKPRKSSSVVYMGEGLRGGLRISKTAFIDGVAPDTFVVSSDVFAPVKTKIVETKEQRKARLAALPRLTLAEKIAKREEALARDKKKLEAQQAKAHVAAEAPASV